MVNRLQVTDGFHDHYQLWFFEYPTGQPFLISAADLRSQIQQADEVFAPHANDESFSNAILVGHSMGGLISKLLVTSSGHRLWESVANQPIENVRMSDDMRAKVTEAFFFEPTPQVGRVVYIGTPHRGSVYAQRLLGKIGSSLVSESEDQRKNHQKLIQCNPGVFTPEITRRIPTSIDMLEPESNLLKAIEGYR